MKFVEINTRCYCSFGFTLRWLLSFFFFFFQWNVELTGVARLVSANEHTVASISALLLNYFGIDELLLYKQWYFNVTHFTFCNFPSFCPKARDRQAFNVVHNRIMHKMRPSSYWVIHVDYHLLSISTESDYNAHTARHKKYSQREKVKPAPGKAWFIIEIDLTLLVLGSRNLLGEGLQHSVNIWLATMKSNILYLRFFLCEYKWMCVFVSTFCFVDFTNWTFIILFSKCQTY